ncbi:hypothetical protein HK099_007951, partial [Clydaea vesicula]
SFTWIQVAEMTGSTPYKRFGNSFNIVDETIYMFGGLDGQNVYNDFWSFDVKTNCWTEIITSGDYKPSERSGHTAVVLNEMNKLLVFGGFTVNPCPSILEDMFILDLANFKWEAVDTTTISSKSTHPGPRLDCSCCKITLTKENNNKLKDFLKIDSTKKINDSDNNHTECLLIFGGMDFSSMLNDVYIKTF